MWPARSATTFLLEKCLHNTLEFREGWGPFAYVYWHFYRFGDAVSQRARR